MSSTLSIKAVGGRGHIEADDIAQRLVRTLDLSPAMRAEPMRVPRRMHRRSGEPNPRRHGPHPPMCGVVRRSLWRQADRLGDLLVIGCSRRARRMGFSCKRPPPPASKTRSGRLSSAERAKRTSSMCRPRRPSSLCPIVRHSRDRFGSAICGEVGCETIAASGLWPSGESDRPVSTHQTRTTRRDLPRSIH